MQAVIMAGGKGTRLSSVTQDLIPKPMVPFCGKPLLERTIEQLADNGVQDIVVCLGWHGDQIIDYFSQWRRTDVTLHFVQEQESLGTAGALAYVQKYIHEDFVFVYGDLAFDIDIQRMLRHHLACKGVVTLFVHPNSHPYDSDLVCCDDAGRVVGFTYKDQPRDRDYENLVSAGLMIISTDIFRFIDEPRKMSLEKELLPQVMRAGETIWAYKSSEYVKDIGTPDRLQAAQKEWESGKAHARNLKNRQKAIFLDRDGTINEYAGLITRPDQIQLINGTAEAIRKINRSEFLAIIVTNQPVIARGDCSLEELRRIHERLFTQLGTEGAYVDDLFFCPHHPDKGFPGEIVQYKIDCTCRKPKPGMLLQAAEQYNIDLAASWMIGDTGRDMSTGRNAGTKTALVHSAATEKDIPYPCDLECANLLDAVLRILDRSENDQTGE